MRAIVAAIAYVILFCGYMTVARAAEPTCLDYNTPGEVLPCRPSLIPESPEAGIPIEPEPIEPQPQAGRDVVSLPPPPPPAPVYRYRNQEEYQADMAEQEEYEYEESVYRGMDAQYRERRLLLDLMGILFDE